MPESATTSRPVSIVVKTTRRVAVAITIAIGVALLLLILWKGSTSALFLRTIVPALSATTVFSLFEVWPRRLPRGVERWILQAGMMSLIIGVLLVMAATGDVRIMRFGMPRGGPRLARHLWRMCFALFIAARSFFSLRERVAQILREPFTTGPMHAGVAFAGDLALVEAVLPTLKKNYGEWEFFAFLAEPNIRDMEAELSGKKRVPQP